MFFSFCRQVKFRGILNYIPYDWIAENDNPTSRESGQVLRGCFRSWNGGLVATIVQPLRGCGGSWNGRFVATIVELPDDRDRFFEFVYELRRSSTIVAMTDSGKTTTPKGLDHNPFYFAAK